MRTEFSTFTKTDGTMAYRSEHPMSRMLYAVLIRSKPVFNEMHVTYARYNKVTEKLFRLKEKAVRTHNREIRKIINHFNLSDQLDKLEEE